MEKMISARGAYFSGLTVFSAVGAIVSPAFGGWDTGLKVLINLIAVDYVFGVIIALVWKRSPKSKTGAFESDASLKGLIRKGAILAIVFVAVQLDLIVHSDGYIRTAVILFFIANEGFSIVENLGIIGVPMPGIIKDAFAAIKNQSNQKNSR